MSTEELLTRDQFRSRCLERDGHRCVLCPTTGDLAVHHIVERRLWPDGGYYLANGASVCGPCHILCEQTNVTCELLRERTGAKVVLPLHLYTDQSYTKWGDPILPSGERLRGELFHDESVQKILAAGNVLQLYTNRVKYARTYHFPWSPGVGKDDRIIDSFAGFEGREVVATVKMDGENTTMYRGYLHARSIDYSPREDRTWVKTLHGRIGYEIPDDWRVCGENLFATHSIHYQALKSYFQMFSIWNESNVCLSWDETRDWASLLGLEMVEVIYRGLWDQDAIQGLYTPEHHGEACEGYVVRVTDAFHYKEFRRCVGKYVRKGHVTSDQHWIHKKVEPNELAVSKQSESNEFSKNSNDRGRPRNAGRNQGTPH